MYTNEILSICILNNNSLLSSRYMVFIKEFVGLSVFRLLSSDISDKNSSEIHVSDVRNTTTLKRTHSKYF